MKLVKILVLIMGILILFKPLPNILMLLQYSLSCSGFVAKVTEIYSLSFMALSWKQSVYTHFGMIKDFLQNFFGVTLLQKCKVQSVISSR